MLLSEEEFSDFFTFPMTFANKVLHFNASLQLNNAILPEGIKVMNPFIGENAEIINKLTAEFYNKFYNDNNKRKLILGINPGRLGAGATGIPFTDTKRLTENCGIPFNTFQLNELSSAFVYEMIEAWGNVADFYQSFYIGAVCPLGFVKKNKRGNYVNYNYYDQKDLEEAVFSFILKTLKQQLNFGIDTKSCFCLGTGKNFKFLKKLNDNYSFFEEIIPLEHPRYIMQYKLKLKQDYIKKYLTFLGK